VLDGRLVLELAPSRAQSDIKKPCDIQLWRRNLNRIMGFGLFNDLALNL